MSPRLGGTGRGGGLGSLCVPPSPAGDGQGSAGWTAVVVPAGEGGEGKPAVGSAQCWSGTWG